MTRIAFFLAMFSVGCSDNFATEDTFSEEVDGSLGGAAQTPSGGGPEGKTGGLQSDTGGDDQAGTGGDEQTSTGGVSGDTGGDTSTGGVSGDTGGDTSTGGEPATGGAPGTGGGDTGPVTGEPCYEEWEAGEYTTLDRVQVGDDIFEACVTTSTDPLLNFDNNCGPGDIWEYVGVCPSRECSDYVVWTGSVSFSPPVQPGMVFFYDGNFWEMSGKEIGWTLDSCPPNSAEAQEWCLDDNTYELRVDCLL